MSAWVEAHPVAAGAVIVMAGFALVIAAKIYGLIFMRGRTVHMIGDEMRGQPCVVSEWSGHEGLVSVGGELWRARSKRSFATGDAAVVKSVNGLLLDVDLQ